VAPVKNATLSGGLVAATVPSVLSGSSATLVHFLYQGNVNMPTTGGGTVTMMKFTADSVTLSDASDAINEGGVTAGPSSPTMALSGNVVLYATQLSGTLGPISLTLTPDSPLLATIGNVITAGQVTLTNVTTDQAMATADSLTYGPGGFAVTIR